MYPQQQHHVTFPNMTQPYYSSNPFLLSFPQQPSDPSLHPPGTDPLGNSILYLPNPTPSPSAAYGPPTTNSQNWIVGQPHPISYDLAVGSSYETSAVSASMPGTSKDTWSHQFYANDASQTSSFQGQVSTGSVGKELESQKRKVLNGGATIDSVKVCTVCNIVCNSQEVLSKHLAGKKHRAQVGLMSNNGIGPYIAAFKRHGIGPWEKAPKKIKVAQSAWCEVCKINCNSRDVYIVHLSGKKHLKNLEKLSKPKIDVASAGNALRCAANPIIGPQEKPGSDKPKSQKTAEMDIEAKKRKVVEGGASAADVRLCTLCNVVCNSQTVFNTHLAGHKHAAAVKKQAESRGATTG